MENSDTNLTFSVGKYLAGLELDAWGYASANNPLFMNAPEGYRPSDILYGAQSVIIIGKSLPQGLFKVKSHQTQVVHRLYHSLYKYLDITAVRIASYLESSGESAITVPSYSPLTMRNLQPWGILSLKHAGVAAGLGQIATNGLLIHPQFGTLLRLAGIITTASLPPNKPLEGNPCTGCDLCLKNCPVQAIGSDGSFKKIQCLRQVVQHGVNKLHSITSPEYRENVELITNTLFLEYTIGCIKCLEVCPINRKPRVMRKASKIDKA